MLHYILVNFLHLFEIWSHCYIKDMKILYNKQLYLLMQTRDLLNNTKRKVKKKEYFKLLLNASLISNEKFENLNEKKYNLLKNRVLNFSNELLCLKVIIHTIIP